MNPIYGAAATLVSFALLWPAIRTEIVKSSDLYKDLERENAELQETVIQFEGYQDAINDAF